MKVDCKGMWCSGGACCVMHSRGLEFDSQCVHIFPTSVSHDLSTPSTCPYAGSNPTSGLEMWSMTDTEFQSLLNVSAHGSMAPLDGSAFLDPFISKPQSLIQVIESNSITPISSISSISSITRVYINNNVVM